jgi:hypothetical protein
MLLHLLIKIFIMKRILLLSITLFIAILFSCKKDEQTVVKSLTPDKVQFAFIGELTSITCGICGSSGYNNFNTIKKNNSGKIIALAVHCNSPDSMTLMPFYSSYNSSRPSGGGIPAFYVGDKKVNNDASEMQNEVNSIISKTPEAQVKFSNKIEGNKMNITAKVKFFTNVTGDYYLSIYLCEHGIDGSPSAPQGYVQSGGSTTYKHNNVIRASNNNNQAYGEKINTSSSINANTVLNYSCSLDIKPTWNRSNLYVSAVIWKKNPDQSATCQYMFVNGWDTQIYK